MVYARYLVAFNFAATILFLGGLLLHPVILDSIHFDDTAFLAHLGWRGVNGFFPIDDYPHFYGGMTARFVTWAFEIFGVDFRAINYAFAMVFGAAVSVLLLLGWGRVSAAGLSLLTVLAAALILSLAPIELGRIGAPRSAHSYVYNHAGLVLMMGLTLFSIVEVTSKRLEIVSALAAGVSIYGLILLKTTFGIFAPFAVIALLSQRRWLSSALVSAGAVLGMVLMDPGMARALGSLEVLLNSAAAATVSNPFFFVYVNVLIVYKQALGVFVVGILYLAYHGRFGRPALQFGFCALLCIAGYFAALTTMGGRPEYKLLPILVVLALVMAEALLRSPAPERGAGTAREGRPAPKNLLIAAIPLALAYSLVLPAAMSASAALKHAIDSRGAALIPGGPAASYVVLGRAVGGAPDLARSVAITIAAIDDMHASEATSIYFDDSMEYVMFADGFALLRQIPGVERYGIISSGRMFDFTAPLQSRPVLSFPVWPTANLEYFTGGAPLGDDVDLVMISRDVPVLGLVRDQLLRKMADDFKPCRKSPLWTLYARKGLPNLPCDPSRES